jgi:hypothetical protein
MTLSMIRAVRATEDLEFRIRKKGGLPCSSRPGITVNDIDGFAVNNICGTGDARVRLVSDSWCAADPLIHTRKEPR